MRDSRFGIRVAGLGVVVGLALQSAHAGDRKSAQPRPRETSIHAPASVAQARSSLRADVPQTLRSGVTSRRGEAANEFSFLPVNPLKSEVRDLRSEVEDAKRAPTSPSERKNVTFFRLDPKLGDISVQPVVGGVNGAQLSMGF